MTTYESLMKEREYLMKKKIFSGTYAWPKDRTEALSITVEDVKRVISGEDVFRKIPLLTGNLNF